MPEQIVPQTTSPERSEQWVTRKLLLGDWLIYQPNPDDPEDITHVVDLGEVRDEQQARGIVARLNGQRPVWAEGQAQREIAEQNGEIYRALHAFIETRARCKLAEWEQRLTTELAEAAMDRMRDFHQAVDARWLQRAEELRRAAEREGQR